jgi:oligoendopeptidase F
LAKGTKELPKRSDIPKEMTWKLDDIFASDDAWEKELKSLKKEIPKIDKYQGTLGESAQNLY